MMARCEEELVASWKLDVAPKQDLASAPELRNGRDTAQRFHRPDALTANHISWNASLRLVIDAEGDVADCVLQAPSFSRRSTRLACDGLARFADFEPARDKQGNPVPALFAITYQFTRFP